MTSIDDRAAVDAARDASDALPRTIFIDSMSSAYPQRIFRRFIIVLAAALLAPSLLAVAFVVFVDPYYIFGMPSWRGINESRPEYETHVVEAKPYQLLRVRPKIVSLGSSRVEVGLNPRNPDWGSSDVFNFAIPGASSYEVLLDFMHAEAIAHPLKQAVVGLDFFAYNIYFKDAVPHDDLRFVGNGLSAYEKFLDETLAERRAAGAQKSAPLIAAPLSATGSGDAKDWDEKLYLALYPDVAAAVARGEFSSGYDHHVKAGHAEGRHYGGVPSDWDEAGYLQANPDVAAAVASHQFISGYQHYLLAGKAEGRQGGFGAGKGWDEKFYLALYPDVAAAVAKGTFSSGYDHYVQAGRAEGRHYGGVPPDWDETAYLQANPDVAAAVARGDFISGYQHYLLAGQKEGRMGGFVPPNWNEAGYLAVNPDAAISVHRGLYKSGFVHYLAVGRAQDRIGGLPPQTLVQWLETKWPPLNGWIFRAQELWALTFSTTAIDDAASTVVNQSTPPSFSALGQRIWRGRDDYLRQLGGEGRLFRSLLVDGYPWYIWFQPPEQLYCFAQTSTGMSMFDNYRFMLRQAYAQGTDLRLYISPINDAARYFENAAGLGPRYEYWVRQLVMIDEEEAAHAGRPPFALWDFRGNSITAERVPAAGDLTPMHWFWDISHFREATGDLILDRIFGKSGPARPVPDDFGIRLTSANVDGEVERERAHLAAWAADNPEFASDLDNAIVKAGGKGFDAVRKKETSCW